MGDLPFIGQLMCTAFNFAPKGWALCNGQLMAINQNQALFSLLGTTYGGDGRTTFALPNLQGRAAVHVGGGIAQGQLGGEVSHTLTTGEMPAHLHAFQAVNAGNNSANPNNNMLGTAANNLLNYGPASGLTPLFPESATSVGQNQAHPNQSPYLVMNWVIALQGIFPSRN